MTTKKPTKAVAEKATNVVKKATTKKPTIKQLQEQYAEATLIIENMEAEIAEKENIIKLMESKIRQKNIELTELSDEIGHLKAAVFNRDKTIEELSKPWWKKVLGLFGN